MYQVMQTLGNGQSALPSVLLRREGGKAYWVKWTPGKVNYASTDTQRKSGHT